MKHTIKIIAYYRVSTKKQGESGLGLDAQKAAVQAFIEHNDATLVAEYTEVESGKFSHRPKLQEALKHARLAKAVIVIAKLDRLARNVAFTAALMDSGVEFICCDTPHATRLTIHILAAVAEDEARRNSKRTKDALAQAKKKGVKLGSARPDHWKGREHKRGWKKAAKNAGIVRAKRARDIYAFLLPMIEEAITSGSSYEKVAEMLNEKGHQTVAGAAFNASTVWRIIKRSKTPIAT